MYVRGARSDACVLDGCNHVCVRFSLRPGAQVGEEDGYVYLPAEGMPLDPVERLRRLFAARKKWRLEDLAPYLR